MTQDRAEAAQWFRRAGEQGGALGFLGLGTMCLSDFGGLPDPGEAGKWFDKTVEKGGADVLVAIGMEYRNHELPGCDAEAVRWFCRAAEQNSVMGQFLAGVANFRGSVCREIASRPSGGCRRQRSRAMPSLN